MTIHVALTHLTEYRYDRLVALGPQVVRLRPAPHCRTPILSYGLTVEPAVHFLNWQQDPFSNYLARLVLPERTDRFSVCIDLVAEMAVYNPFDFFLEPSAERFPFKYDAGLAHDLAPYLAKLDGELARVPRFQKLLASIDRTPRRTIDFIVEINRLIQSEIAYLIRLEPGVQTPEQTLELASGSCRDSGWLLVQLLRHLGLAARFVSGYLIQLRADVKALDGPSGTEQDFTDLHAWCEVYLPGAGWIGLDPTSGLLAGEGHIPLACTPDPTGAAPITGAVDKAEVEFTHTMRVTRIFESPRVTLPYSEAQWQEILALGHAVDLRLASDDVRLTQGGEPTFVAVDDREGEEWNTAALGPKKRAYAIDLVQRLRAHYGRGGFLHFGQGKWYPGEQLPRWALSICWRSDGKPCWLDPELFADERSPGDASTEDARALLAAIARELALDEKFLIAGFEDVYYYLWRERKLPSNLDPFDARLDDEIERARLRRIFDQGLKKVVGWALPVRRNPEHGGRGGRWISGPWFLRDERMYLIPGDSPMGWRLPLDSLPWVASTERETQFARDPSAPAAGLPDRVEPTLQQAPHLELEQRTVARRRAAAALGERGAATGEGAAETSSERLPQRFESAGWLTRTALCVEARNGILYVFMPPMQELEDYLEIVAAVENAARVRGVKLMLEGYAPPRDTRLKVLQVTPDPGVIEVNIHPAANWDELVEHSEFLYQAAFESRLSSEKFMLDGRHTGTGGGNHFVLGGATPADSPFLRRPDLLASLISYWHNHPSLSYLFSGMFIGPTSQAPRIDEARNDQTYEAEIAFAEIERQLGLLGTQVPPWMVDRALRNILVDVTGNTHRTEFCIDKLFSPDGPTGRLGLLELRAFEMPPHARMSLVQQLLLRALVAHFWRTPYRAHLTRWGTELHDRFLLPTFVAMDFEDVLGELCASGLGFDASWFAPHFEFRFPKYGEMDARGIHLELRAALEPWHVLGEEGSVGGTARYVDSSLERLEVKLSGYNPGRYVITVNGRPLALQPTGRVGEHVGGVRYKAWAPYSALHPSIGVQAPLVFDVIDTWNRRSLGGCAYHVAHPGGRNYTTFPVNAFEAESRRRGRFSGVEHTPGAIDVVSAPRSREFPFTLDLRQR